MCLDDKKLSEWVSEHRQITKNRPSAAVEVKQTEIPFRTDDGLDNPLLGHASRPYRTAE